MRPCRFFLRREGVHGIDQLVVFLFHRRITFCNKCKLYIMNEIGGGVRKVISDLNGVLCPDSFLTL